MLAVLFAVIGIVFVVLGLAHVVSVAVGLGIGLIAVLAIQLVAGVGPIVNRRDIP